LVKEPVISNVELPFPSPGQAEGGGDIRGLIVVLGGGHLDADRFTFAEKV
jgi:hypothetical protein